MAVTPADAAVELLKRRNARRSLISFAQYTNARYVPGKHHHIIADALERVEAGEIRRLLICAPPRHGKSELASRDFPAWYLGKHPERTVISTSYAAALAEEFGRDVRNIVASPEYGTLFPHVRLAADSQARNRWNVTGTDARVRGGGYIAAGVDGPITGKGAWLFIIDDPHKNRAEAESLVSRETVWHWYLGDVLKRLDDVNAAVVLILTRWHEDDIVARIESLAHTTGEQWTRVILPASTDEHGDVVPPDAPGARALWPERFPISYLLEKYKESAYDWASEYEQTPRPRGGSFFTESDLLVDGKPIEPPQKCMIVYAIIDSAMKTGKDHDGLAVAFWAQYTHVSWVPDTPPRRPWLCLLDWDYLQVEGAGLERWLPSVFARLELFASDLLALDGSRGAFIEDKVSGTVLLQQGMNHGWPVTAIPSGLTAMGKSERALDVHWATRAQLVKVSRQAWERVTTFKGHTKNHMRSQVLGFRAGSQETGPDDLLDDFTYGIALGLGNREGF